LTSTFPAASATSNEPELLGGGVVQVKLSCTLVIAGPKGIASKATVTPDPEVPVCNEPTGVKLTVGVVVAPPGGYTVAGTAVAIPAIGS
jgi:hypothetical protein